MRLTSIAARELLSFQALDIDNIPSGTFVVVGPNAAGKTNLSRVVEIARAVVERSANPSQDLYALLARFGLTRRFEADPDTLSSVRLGIAFTEDHEIDHLLHFIRAALTSSILREAPSNADTSGLMAWAKEISADMLDPLTRGEIVAELLDASTGEWALSYEFLADSELFHWVLAGTLPLGALVRVTERTIGPAAQPLDVVFAIDGNRIPHKPFAFAGLLPPPGKMLVLSLESGPLPARVVVREWASRAGIAVAEPQNRSYTFATVLHVLLERGLLMLSDVRQPPAVEYSLIDTTFDPSPADGNRTPMRLFRWKNGSPQERSRFLASRRLFERLTDRTFDITLATHAANRTGEAPANIVVSPVVGLRGRDLSIEFAGAGAWEALLLSAALADSTGRVLLLDEPARNLHPTLQRRLLDEMRSAPGQFIVTTHSPYLVDIEVPGNLAGLIRFDLRHGVTHTSRLTASSDATDARLHKVLCESTDARALLFARAVVLVEGDTELGALPEWFAKSATARKAGTPDALNIALFSVGGDRGYSTLVRYLYTLGIPWVIVCDGAIFRFAIGKPPIFEQVLKAGVEADELRVNVDSSTTGDSAAFSQMRDIGARNGIFTLATSWDPPDEAFETFIEKAAPGELVAAEAIVHNSKARKGRHVATTTECPAEVDALYAEILTRLDINAQPTEG